MDRSGQKSVDNPAVGRLAVGGRDPPCRRFGGGDSSGTKHLQKKFFKKIKNELTK